MLIPPGYFVTRRTTVLANDPRGAEVFMVVRRPDGRFEMLHGFAGEGFTQLASFNGPHCGEGDSKTCQSVALADFFEWEEGEIQSEEIFSLNDAPRMHRVVIYGRTGAMRRVTQMHIIKALEPHAQRSEVAAILARVTSPCSRMFKGFDDDASVAEDWNAPADCLTFPALVGLALTKLIALRFNGNQLQIADLRRQAASFQGDARVLCDAISEHPATACAFSAELQAIATMA